MFTSSPASDISPPTFSLTKFASLNFEHFIVVPFWFPFRCVFLERFSNRNLLIVSHHFSLGCQFAKELHFLLILTYLYPFFFLRQFLARSYIAHLCATLFVVPHFWHGLQRALYFSLKFEHFAIVRFFMKFSVPVSFTILYFTFRSEVNLRPSFLTRAPKILNSLPSSIFDEILGAYFFHDSLWHISFTILHDTISSLAGESRRILPHPRFNCCRGLVRSKQFDVDDMEDFKDLLQEHDLES